MYAGCLASFARLKGVAFAFDAHDVPWRSIIFANLLEQVSADCSPTVTVAPKRCKYEH